MLNIGDLAPEFELLDSESVQVKLSDFLGQKIVVFFYPAADTDGCTRQACGFRDNFAEIREVDGTVVGISPDQPADLAKWKKKRNLPFTLLSDPDHEVAERYGVWGEKTNFGRTYMGIIRSHFIIDPEGKLADIQFKVSPENSVKRAMNSLTE
jgi:peroxiredoxin Q/BCP